MTIRSENVSMQESYAMHYFCLNCANTLDIDDLFLNRHKIIVDVRFFFFIFNFVFLNVLERKKMRFYRPAQTVCDSKYVLYSVILFEISFFMIFIVSFLNFFYHEISLLFFSLYKRIAN